MHVGEKKSILFRWEAVLAAFLLILSMAVTLLPGMWVGAEDGDTQPGGDSLSNQIWVIPEEKIPVVIAGGGATEIKIFYNSNIDDDNAQITIGMPSGLYLRNTASTQKVKIEKNTDNNNYSTYFPSFKVEADKDAASGIVPITITTIYHLKGTNQQVSESMTYSVRIVNPEIPESSDTEEPSAPELIGNQITVSKNAFMPEIKAGETKEILIPLNATSVVGSAQVTLTMPDGLYLESAAATQTVNFKKGSATISCRVTAKQDVTDSVAAISIDSVYSYDNKQTTEKTTFSVRLRASDDIKSNGKLVITGYQLGSSTLSYNGDTSLTITVQNTGSATMKDITMTLDGMATGSVTLKSGMDVQTLVELGPGQQSTFTYQLHGDEALPSGTAILTATAACGEENSVAKVFVPCVGKPEETSGGEGESGPGSSKPQVIIENYTYGEDAASVTGGSTFTLGMTLRNTSSSSAIENIKMVVSSAADETTGGVFTPASSSNSFFIARVGAGESFSESIDLTVKADAPPKSYGIDIEISYEAVIDGKRESLTSTERITIPVSQPDRFEVEDAQISSTVYVGDSAYCSVSYVNKGKSAVYNLSIAVEGTGFTTADANTYVGNVEAGNGDYFETSLNVTEPGTIDGKFVITYEDSAGTQTTLERPFTATVMEMDWGTPDDMEPMEPVDVEPSMPLWGKILIIAGCVVVAGGIVVVVLRIRRKKRKAVPVFDDEDDDDYGDDDFDE